MSSSEYTPIWNALKASDKVPKQVSITANRLLHPRIIKAVTKRKWLDLGYKLQIEPRHSILTHTCNGSTITFFLTFYISDSVTITLKDI